MTVTRKSAAQMARERKDARDAERAPSCRLARTDHLIDDAPPRGTPRSQADWDVFIS
jgi:hypothetical protein